MELRSQSRTKKKVEEDEIAEMRITLIGLGLYEENMDLKEMQQIVQALQMSQEPNRNEDEEIDLSFGTSGDMMANSTIDDDDRRPVWGEYSPSASPSRDYEILTVHAVVHHSIDWSPPRNKDANSSEEKIEISSRKRILDQDFTIKAKRLRLKSNENDPDSGISLCNSYSSDPTSEIDFD